MRLSAYRLPAPRSFVTGAFALLALLALAARPASACTVTPRQSVPLEQADGLLLVTLTVNATPLRFVLDTGAARTVIAEPAALAIRLARDEWVSTDITGIGGRERKRLGRPDTLALGQLPLFRRTMASDNTIVVGTLQITAGGRPVDGLLGQDFLSAYDVEIDTPRHRLTLYDVTRCVGAFLPWREPYSTTPAMRVGSMLILPVGLAGEDLRAELDTGAQTSLLLAPGARRLGLQSVAPDGALHLRGFGAGMQTARLQRFDKIRVGAETIPAMTLLVTQAHALRSVDMLLGADWFTPRRVWLSWATDQVMAATLAASATPVSR